jgi:hypothetical protein
MSQFIISGTVVVATTKSEAIRIYQEMNER